nr:MAG TPA: hypothetical protein [Caudoviricetes sp.]
MYLFLLHLHLVPAGNLLPHLSHLLYIGTVITSIKKDHASSTVLYLD